MRLLSYPQNIICKHVSSDLLCDLTGRDIQRVYIFPCLDPQAPRSVTSLCEVIVWQAPSRAYGAITGYDVIFADTVSTSNSSVVQNLVLKDRDQLFHVVRESDLPRPGGAPMIQVSNTLLYIYCVFQRDQ